MKSLCLLLVISCFCFSGCHQISLKEMTPEYDLNHLGFNFINPKINNDSVNLQLVDFERGFNAHTALYDDTFAKYTYILFIDGHLEGVKNSMDFKIDKSMLTTKPTDIIIKVYNRYDRLEFSIQWDDYMIFDHTMNPDDILRYKDELQSVMFYNQPKDMTILEELENLKHLTFSNCDIPDTSLILGLDMLKSVQFIDCNNLADISDLNKLPQLEVLAFEQCDCLCDVEPLQYSESLQRIFFIGCDGLTEIGSLRDMPNVNYINTMFSYNISDSDTFRDEIQIDSGDVTVCNNNFIGNQLLRHGYYSENLMSLTLDDFDIGIFHDYQAADHSFELYIDGILAMRNNKNLFNLNVADFSDTPHEIMIVAKDDDMVATHELSYDRAMIYNEVRNRNESDNYKDAQVLFIYGNVTDTSIFGTMPDLVAFRMCNGFLVDLSFVSQLPKLKQITFESVVGIRDLSPLTDLNHLEFFVCSKCEGLTDVSPLAEIDSLKYIFLPDCNDVTDVSKLAELPNLVYIYPPSQLDITAFDNRTDVKVANYLLQIP